VGDVQSGVDDFDDLVFTLVGGLVGAGHFERGGVLEDGDAGGFLPFRHGCDGARGEGGFDAAGGLDGAESGGGRLEREAVHRMAVLAERRDGGTGKSLRDGDGDAVVGLGAVGPVLKLDDDGGLLVGRRGLGRVRGLREGGGADVCMACPVRCERSWDGEG
jgi:hypothetical protein